jgi:hypothetical protein
LSETSQLDIEEFDEEDDSSDDLVVENEGEADSD